MKAPAVEFCESCGLATQSFHGQTLPCASPVCPKAPRAAFVEVQWPAKREGYVESAILKRTGFDFDMPSRDFKRWEWIEMLCRPRGDTESRS